MRRVPRYLNKRSLTRFSQNTQRIKNDTTLPIQELKKVLAERGLSNCTEVSTNKNCGQTQEPKYSKSSSTLKQIGSTKRLKWKGEKKSPFCAAVGNWSCAEVTGQPHRKRPATDHCLSRKRSALPPPTVEMRPVRQHSLQLDWPCTSHSYKHPYSHDCVMDTHRAKVHVCLSSWYFFLN